MHIVPFLVFGIPLRFLVGQTPCPTRRRLNDKVVAAVRGAAAAELTLWAYAVGGGAARDVNRATMKELLIIKEVVGEFLFDSLLRPLDELNLVPLLK